MDRLISEKAVLDAICHDKCGLSPNRCMSGITGECVQIKPIKAIPSAEQKIVPIANIHFDEDKMREVCKEVAENIVVEYDFKGKTNGEVIKMLYPQGEIVKGLYGISGNPLICVNLNISTECSEMVFTEDWWNSPYEPHESEVDNE